MGGWRLAGVVGWNLAGAAGWKAGTWLAPGAYFPGILGCVLSGAAGTLTALLCPLHLPPCHLLDFLSPQDHKNNYIYAPVRKKIDKYA